MDHGVGYFLGHLIAALQNYVSGMPTVDLIWLAIGLVGQSLFMMRFIVQWIHSERHQQSLIPVSFWYFSLVGGLTVLVFFWGLGDIGLMSFNEARRALPAQAMFLEGDWLLPHLNGELYLAKPPLLYWLAASASFLFGAANEWAVRLPSALAAAATVW